MNRMPATAAPASAAQELLQALIRFNTVNPPGNELPGAGVPRRVPGVGGLPVRAARLHPGAAEPRGEAAGRRRRPPRRPALCYLGHVDTVLANPQEWSHDPWSGDIADGFLWGRGALDMKDQVAAEIAAAGAGALGLAPLAGRAADRDGRGRGDRRLARGPVDHRKPPRQGALRPARQRGRGRGLRYQGNAATASAAPRRASSASPSAPPAWPATPRCRAWASTRC